MALKFEILKRIGKTRLGILHTKHGDVHTPAFMPVGTCGTVKAMMPESVAAKVHALEYRYFPIEIEKEIEKLS